MVWRPWRAWVTTWTDDELGQERGLSLRMLLCASSHSQRTGEAIGGDCDGEARRCRRREVAEGWMVEAGAGELSGLSVNWRCEQGRGS